uniref:hypothetical protein n=1 Tax=Mycobacterium avium TaxID=1764 RepID=UPI001E5A72FE
RAERRARMSFPGATWQETATALGSRSRQAAQRAVKRLDAAPPAETVEQARARHDGALRLLQRQNFTRYAHAIEGGDDDTALGYSKELRGIVTERAKLAGVASSSRLTASCAAWRLR